MNAPDRFDELAQSLGGFYRSWIVYLGLDLGLFENVRRAGQAGIGLAALANESACAAEPVEVWARAAHASGLVEFDGELLRLDEATASVLLDDTRPEYLGGQFVAAV